jgi:hypothetical protein
MHQQLWGYKVEEKLYLGVHEQKKVEYHWSTLLLSNKDAVLLVTSWPPITVSPWLNEQMGETFEISNLYL